MLTASLKTRALVAFAIVLLALPVLAHHSFAIFDFQTQIPFEGTVESLKFRNPHIEMTLKSIGPDGEEQVIRFIEGAPANMLVRSGLRPEMIAPGTHIVATGSPLIEDSALDPGEVRYFLRLIRLDDGQEF